MSGVMDSEDELTHPLGFSNLVGKGGVSEGSINNNSFLDEI